MFAPQGLSSLLCLCEIAALPLLQKNPTVSEVSQLTRAEGRMPQLSQSWEAKRTSTRAGVLGSTFRAIGSNECRAFTSFREPEMVAKTLLRRKPQNSEAVKAS